VILLDPIVQVLALPDRDGLCCFAGPELAATTQARYRAFVGSRRKAETLRRELAAEGVPMEGLTAIKAPAGLDIGAISTDEIALSILAEMVAARRRAQHAAPSVASTS